MGSLTFQQIGCYWWATVDGLRTECGKSPKPVHWPRSGTNCECCGKVMAYADNEADAKKLHADGHDKLPHHHK